MNQLDIFIKRLDKIGIKLTLIGNYPWIYLDTINGKRVTENYLANHGFTVFFHSREGYNITDITKIFTLIRKYL